MNQETLLSQLSEIVAKREPRMERGTAAKERKKRNG